MFEVEGVWICRNLNIGFGIKCEMQECVYLWNTLPQMGESARDET
jgi:hypothetical protein